MTWVDIPKARCDFQDMFMVERCGELAENFHRVKHTWVLVPAERGVPDQHYCPKHADAVSVATKGRA